MLTNDSTKLPSSCKGYYFSQTISSASDMLFSQILSHRHWLIIPTLLPYYITVLVHLDRHQFPLTIVPPWVTIDLISTSPFTRQLKQTIHHSELSWKWHEDFFLASGLQLLSGSSLRKSNDDRFCFKLQNPWKAPK